MIQKLLNIFFKKKFVCPEAVILQRAEHSISRKQINPHALKVLYRLHSGGFAAYLVGGGVRDLLLGRVPKDFDVATNASPEQVKNLFRNCLLIGRRFRIAHVRFGQDIIEVTTFRALGAHNDDDRARSKLGMLLRDNVYGTIEEDALRRDFTVNALYYNIADFSITDFAQGLPDLENKMIRLIGKPQLRYQEDPVRILRAIRFAAKLGFNLEEQTERAIKPCANLLIHVAPARMFDEFIKLFFHGHGKSAYVLLEKYDLIKYLLPIDETQSVNHQYTFIMDALAKTDERVAQDQSVNPAFLLAVFLWSKFIITQETLRSKRMSAAMATQKALAHVLSSQELPMAIPRRNTEIIRDIWALQWRLTSLLKQHAVAASLHKRVRAAYDFLLLRAQSDASLMSAATWWTQFLEADHDAQQLLLEQLPAASKKPKRWNNNRNRRRGKNNQRVHSTGE